jgi:hypothetical protein
MPDDDLDVGPPTFGELWRSYREHRRDTRQWQADHEEGHKWMNRTIAGLALAVVISVILAQAGVTP